MANRSETKIKRQDQLAALVKDSPFITDHEISHRLGVSVGTVRLDRAAMGIPEQKERMMNAARVQKGTKERVISCDELIEVADHKGFSVMTLSESMCYEGTNVVKNQYLYSMAENLATATAGFKACIVKVSDAKASSVSLPGDRLFAKSEVKLIRDTSYIVWVRIYKNSTEVFRAKFSIKEEKEGTGL